MNNKINNVTLWKTVNRSSKNSETMALLYQPKNLQILSRYHHVQMQVFSFFTKGEILLNCSKVSTLLRPNSCKPQLTVTLDSDWEVTFFRPIFTTKYSPELKSVIWMHLLLVITHLSRENLPSNKKSLFRHIKRIKRTMKAKAGT